MTRNRVVKPNLKLRRQKLQKVLVRAEAGLRGVRGVDLLEVAPEQTLGREVLVAAAPPAQQPPGAACSL